nr:hypothetical protein CFP56_75821 [Quercus suber]
MRTIVNELSVSNDIPVPSVEVLQLQFLEPTRIEQRAVAAAIVETETGGSDSAVEISEIIVFEMPEIFAGENLTKKSEEK